MGFLKRRESVCVRVLYISLKNTLCFCANQIVFFLIKEMLMSKITADEYFSYIVDLQTTRMNLEAVCRVVIGISKAEMTAC